MWSYILPIVVALLAMLQLAKDWGAHKTHWRRAIVFALILLVAIGSGISNYYATRNAAERHTQDQAQIAGLKTAVDTANQSQEANTKLFVDAFGRLSQKVSDLQTGAATAALQKRLASVQFELQNTQKALAPGPKAKLSFTFFPYADGVLGVSPAVPATDLTLPLSPDNTVHFEFTVLNLTDVDAMDGQYAILVCDACRFAKEPTGFAKVEGRPDNERYTTFIKIPAKSQGPLLGKIDVLVPLFVDTISVGIVYRCHTCELPHSLEGRSGTIHILR